MHIPRIPYGKWFPLLALVLAAPATADDSAADHPQIAVELREVAAFERSVERALDAAIERQMSALVTQEFERQAEHLAQTYDFVPRSSVPASSAPR